MKRKSVWKMQDLTSIISTTMVLILLGLIVLFVLTAQALGDSVRENLTVTVDLKDGVTTMEAKKLQAQLTEEAFVADINYISSEQALKEHRESMGIDPTELLGANPFPISMEIKVRAAYACNDSLHWITRDLKQLPAVAEVVYQKELVESLNHNLQRASLVLLVIAALLILVSLSLIHNTVRLSVYGQRFIIHTMKLVGARWSFIRRPFMLRSLWTGLFSGFLADAILFGGIQWAVAHDNAITEYVSLPSIGIMAACVLACGLIITMVCTYLSVTHYLRLRESEMY
jgi:cell division transport system permease protein